MKRFLTSVASVWERRIIRESGRRKVVRRRALDTLETSFICRNDVKKRKNNITKREDGKKKTKIRARKNKNREWQ